MREQVDAERIDVEVEQAGGLHGVRVEDGVRVLRLDDARGLGDRLDRADLVVHVHDADEGGLVRDRRLQLREVDEALAVDAEVGDAEALLLEPLGRVEDGVVLDGGRDDVVAAAGAAGGPGGAAQRQVVATRCRRR